MREFFPALANTSLVYFDNAATTQKPQSVLEAQYQHLARPVTNIARGVHTLGAERTEEFEAVRTKTKSFLSASSEDEIVFTRGSTESINLVASSWGRTNLKAGDVVLCSVMEHHANIVPWQQVALQTGATVLPIPLTPEFDIDEESFESLLNDHPVKLVALTHVSNALGVVNPVKKLINKAHDSGALVLIDGAQAVSHFRINVQDLGADFYVFGAHKMYGPTGIGVLYGKKEIIHSLPPYQTGGGMIENVSFDGTTFLESPQRFEAGTPNSEGVFAFSAALDFTEQIVADKDLAANQKELFQEARKMLESVKAVTIYGTGAKEQTSILSFAYDGVHAHDVGSVFDSCGVAVRSGHHCCMPLMDYLGVTATTRISFACYNTIEELPKLLEALHKVERVFR